MIKKKKKICKECGDEKYIFSRGRCQTCASKTYKKPKKYTESKKQEKKVRSDKLQSYFDYHISKCNKSDESGITIYNPTRASICHIFPKRIYKSVEDNIDNAIYLTVNEHTIFDSFMDKMDLEKVRMNFPNAWKKIENRVRKLLPYVKENKILKRKFEDFLDIKN